MIQLKLRFTILLIIFIIFATGCEDSQLAAILTPQPTVDSATEPPAAATDSPAAEAPAAGTEAQETPQTADDTEAPLDEAPPALITLLDPQPLETYDSLPQYVALDSCLVDFSFFGLQPDQYECGYVVVAADHLADGGNAINVGVVKFPARAADPLPDPLFVALGEPGASTVGAAPFLLHMPWFEQTNADRDIIFFDQRGAQATAPILPCDGYGEAREQALADGRFAEDAATLAAGAIADCATSFSDEGWDLSTFNSLQNAADLYEIRSALGYDQINFYGTSYGATLGQHLLRDYPEILRTVTLDGSEPLESNRGLDAGPLNQAALDAFVAACAADAACSQLYPELETTIDDLYEALEDSPATVTALNYESGETRDLPLDGDMLVTILFDKMGSAANYPALLQGLQAAVSGDYDYFGNNLDSALDMTGAAVLAHFAVVCAEDAGFTLADARLEEVTPLIANYSFIDAAQYLAVCEQLNVAQLAEFANNPVASDLPLLLLSGALDPQTPPSELSLMLPELSSASSFIVPDGAHGQLFSGGECVASIFTQFLNDPSSEPDGGCLQELAVNFTDIGGGTFVRQESSEESAGEATPCTATSTADIVVFDRPDVAADIFATGLPPVGVAIQARTMNGWLGFDPGVAQAANVGPFRLRWIKGDENVTLSESCATQSLPVVEALPPRVCFTMAMDVQDVYAQADEASEVLATMNAGDYAAVTGSSDDGNWAQLDLSVGSLDGDGSGWLPASNLNLNGNCG